MVLSSRHVVAAVLKFATFYLLTYRMSTKTKLILGVAVAAMAAGAVEFHVNPAAEPGGDGSAARPFATLVAARDGLRTARKTGVVAGDARVDIVLASGDYVLAAGFVLDAQDGGASADAPVTWKAAHPGTARITGGRRVPVAGCRIVTDPAILARLPEDARGKVYEADVAALLPEKLAPMADHFGMTPTAPLLFMNHTIATLARWPNVGFSSFSKRVDRGAVIKRHAGSSAEYGPGAFIYENPRAKRWNFAQGVWMNGYWTHDWDNHSVRAAAYGVENGTNDVVRLAAGVPRGVMGGTWGPKDRRFYVFNVLDELDAPNEWYLDRAMKKLYFYPPNGVLAATDEVVLASFGEPLVGTSKHIDHLRMQGLVFEYTYATGVRLTGQDVQVCDCRVACCGAAGVSMYGNRNVIRGCEVTQIASVGFSVSGGNCRKLHRAETVVENNHIHDFSIMQRTYAAGVSVNGCGITLRANVIHEAPHMAVMYDGNEHVFEYNNVYRVLLETGDAGAYYTGRNWTSQGNVLRFNYTHDLGAEGEWANTMGFYFDDCDCGDAVYGNIFHNVARGIMVGGGRDHPIRNNIFSRCLVGLSIDCRGMTSKQWNSMEFGGPSWMLEDKAKAFSYTNGVWAAHYPRLANIMNDYPREPLYNPVEENIFIDCKKQLLALDGKAPLERMAVIARNVVVNTRGTNGVAWAAPDQRIASGFMLLNGTTNAPCAFGFVDAAKGDFHFLPDAEILKVCPGFQVLPLDRIPMDVTLPVPSCPRKY